jgi:hypothetical protein
MIEKQMDLEVKEPLRKRRKIGRVQIPPTLSTIRDLIEMAQTGQTYENIDTEILWKIVPQLIEMDEMIGMDTLKQTLFYQIIYYLQHLHVGDSSMYMHTVITGPPGSGKCFAPGTLIRMADGTMQYVERIEQGDLIMGDDGSPRTVTSTCRGVSEMYQLSFATTEVTVNRAHVLVLYDIQAQTTLEMDVATYLEQTEAWKLSNVGFRAPLPFPEQGTLEVDPYVLGYVMYASFIREEAPPLLYVRTPRIAQYLKQHQVIDMEDPGVSRMYTYMHPTLDVMYPDVWIRQPPPWNVWTRTQWFEWIGGVLDALSESAWENETRIIQYTHTDDYLAMCQVLDTVCLPYRANPSKLQLLFPYVDQWVPSRLLESTTVRFPTCVYEPFTITQVDSGLYVGFELEGTNGRFLLGNGIVTHNTTIARIIGEMYKNIGVLSPDGEFRIAKREDFVAEYLGQTAIKTKKLLQSCLGGVLFIDEVYALGPGRNDKDSFSKEAIDTLNVFLSEHSNSFCCIIAGYEKEVKDCFFSVNQGLRRRFQWVHRIGTYTTDQLAGMFQKMVQDSQWVSHIPVKALIEILDQYKHLFSALGGDIENLFTKCKMAHARRILSQSHPDRFLLTLEDLKDAIRLIEPNQITESNSSMDEAVRFMYI